MHFSPLFRYSFSLVLFFSSTPNIYLFRTSTRNIQWNRLLFCCWINPTSVEKYAHIYRISGQSSCHRICRQIQALYAIKLLCSGKG